MTIYLIRHGETDWNRQNRLQGTEDIELNVTGIAQSVDCARTVSAIPAEVILSSPLKRARVTAEIISEQMGRIPVIVEQDLIERDFGPLSGVALKDRQALLGYGSDPQMEPFEHLTERLMGVLRRYISEKKYETILVVSHGGSINAILSVLSGGKIGTGKTVLRNVCISRLNVSGGAIDIEYHNLTPAEFEAKAAGG
jgi:broad specificity phosphatase PhoE